MSKYTISLKKYHLWTWTKVIVSISILTGLTSTLFLFLLNVVTDYRENNLWIIALLPLAGITIVYSYKKYGQAAHKGNNLLLEEYYHPQGKIPWLMTPLILSSTLITHLFGGSAGREGTAVQYGGTYADRIARYFGLHKEQIRIALVAGVAAGFASLFGTPIAGTFFAIEVFKIGNLRYKAFPIIAITAFFSNYIGILLHAPHTHYDSITISNYFNVAHLWIIPVAIACGLTARLFLWSNAFWIKAFKPISNPYYKVVFGALLIILLIYTIGTTKYIGLGVPSILEALREPAAPYNFLIKILLTTLTLSIGFKGGEVTPLFFIGTTLTSFLSFYIPVSTPLMAGLGFVAVFAGSTKTPLASALMALELFGWAIFPLAIITTMITVSVSGRKGIYSSQRNFKQLL